jgi:hypothetical protein
MRFVPREIFLASVVRFHTEYCGGENCERMTARLLIAQMALLSLAILLILSTGFAADDRGRNNSPVSVPLGLLRPTVQCRLGPDVQS